MIIINLIDYNNYTIYYKPISYHTNTNNEINDSENEEKMEIPIDYK